MAASSATEGLSRYIIDPDGDVEIVLKNPNRQNLDWHPEDKVTPKHMEAWAKTPKAERGAFPGLKNTVATGAELDATEPGNDEPGHDEPGHDEPEQDVTILASSSHLCLASETFRKMLRGPWLEGASGASEGSVKKCTASEWDTNAFTTVLYIIHGRHRAVPSAVDLETLAKIAAIVDYYHCHEATEVLIQRWIKPAAFPVPVAEYGKDCMLRMLVAWVFRQRDIFEEMARLAVMQSQGPLQTMDLPFPKTLLGSSAPRKVAC